jgi:ATP-dependent protease ClpP protease subunit
MRSSKADITCQIEGVCHSAATYVFLSADTWVVLPNVLFMIHNYSGGAYGKGQELIQNVKANDDWVRSIMANVYEGFITEKELEKVNMNQDIWMESEEIMERLENVITLRNARVVEEEAAQKRALLEQLEEFKNEEQNTSSDGESTPGI